MIRGESDDQGRERGARPKRRAWPEQCAGPERRAGSERRAGPERWAGQSGGQGQSSEQGEKPGSHLPSQPHSSRRAQNWSPPDDRPAAQKPASKATDVDLLTSMTNRLNALEKNMDAQGRGEWGAEARAMGTAQAAGL